jgi:tripartite-type tricarboxylate transporter receptor subunit TctC
MAALARPEVRAGFANTGNVIAPLNSAEFSAFIQSEIAKWAVLVKLAGLEPE